MNACGLSNKIIDKTNINEQKKDFFQEHIGTWIGSHDVVLNNTQCIWGEKFIFSTDNTYRREYYITPFFSDYKFIGYGKIKTDINQEYDFASKNLPSIQLLTKGGAPVIDISEILDSIISQTSFNGIFLYFEFIKYFLGKKLSTS